VILNDLNGILIFADLDSLGENTDSINNAKIFLMAREINKRS
jgi:hypothetical protein